MKTLKKIGALALILAMVLSLAMTGVFAAKITVNDKGPVVGSGNYAAYQLLTASAAADSDDIVYKVNEKYESILKEVTKAEDEVGIIAAIAAMKGDADAIRAFADEVYAKIVAAELDADATAVGGVFANVDQGYYLIAETGKLADGDARSLVILDTAGNDDITVDAKEEEPTFEKDVYEKNDSDKDDEKTGWGKSADHDIGDDVQFRLTGNYKDISEYEHYYFAFHDELQDTLEFDPTSVEVYINGTKVTTGYTVVTNPEDNCTFEVVFEDLKTLVPDALTGGKVEIIYNAELKDDAVIGNPGNKNTAKLEYSNNPYYDGEGKPGPDDTTETPPETVVVFTYEMDVNKVDENGDELDGAGFTLFKWDDEENDWVAVGDEIKGVTTFKFEGIDAGKYKLEETTVPAGYNKAEDIEFTVVATYEDTGEALIEKLEVLDAEGNTVIGDADGGKIFTTDFNAGTLTTDVENKTGSKLPSTGSIGTAIFFLIGGLTVVCTGVLLVTKRRMKGLA